MDTDELKTLLNRSESDTTNDAYYTAQIPVLLEYANQYCKQEFDDEDVYDDLPGGVKLFIAKAAEWNLNKAGIQAKSAGDLSVAYAVTDMPSAILAYLKPYRRVGFV